MGNCLSLLTVQDRAETDHQQNSHAARCLHPRRAAAFVESLLVRIRCYMIASLLLQAAYGAGLPFPLNYILPYTQRRRVQRLLKNTSAEKV